MKKTYYKLFKSASSVTITVIVSCLMIVGFAWASTTISSNISTDGTLTVTGASTFTGLATFDHATTTSATSTDYVYIGPDGTENFFDFAGGDLYVADDAEVESDLIVGNKATSTVAVWIGAAGTADKVNLTGGDLYVQNDAEIDGTLHLSGDGSELDLAAEATRAINVFTTSALTSGTVKAVEIDHTQTGDGATILEALRVNIDTEVQTGSWANAIVGRINYGTAGDAGGGMAAAICAEMNLPARNVASVGGSYHALDLELNAPENYVANSGNKYPVSFQRFGLWGNATAMGSFEDNGFIFQFADFTAAAGNVISANSQTARVLVDEADRYLVMSQAEDSLSLTTTATAVDLTTTLSGTTADSVLAIATTDNQTQTSGYTKSLSIAHTIGATGDKTGSSESEAIGIDYTIAGDTPYAYGIMYYSTSGGTDPTIGFAAPISIYQEDLGDNLSEYAGIDVGLNFDAHAPDGRYTFMRFRNHSALGNPDSIFLLEGADTSTYLLELATGAGQEPYAASGAAGSTSFWADVDGYLKVKVGSDIMYIPLFHD